MARAQRNMGLDFGSGWLKDSDGTGIQNAWINVYTRSWNYLTRYGRTHMETTGGGTPRRKLLFTVWHDNTVGWVSYNSAPTQGAATQWASHGNDTPDINFSLSQYDSIYVSKESSCSGHSLCFQNIQNGIASASVPTEVKITQEPIMRNHSRFWPSDYSPGRMGYEFTSYSSTPPLMVPSRLPMERWLSRISFCNRVIEPKIWVWWP